MSIVIRSPDMIMWFCYKALKELGADVHIPWITTEYKTRHDNVDFKEKEFDYELAEHPKYFTDSKAKKILYLCDYPRASYESSYKRVYLVISPSEGYYKALKKKGLNSLYLPFGYDPDTFYELPNAKPTEDCCFIGSPFDSGFRNDWADRHDIDFFQGNWEFSKRLYSQYKILVNAPDMWADNPESKDKADYHTTRVFEAMGCGILVMDLKRKKCPRTILEYDDDKHMHELIDHFLNNEHERKQLAEIQQREVFYNHTWKHRMKRLLKVIQ